MGGNLNTDRQGDRCVQVQRIPDPGSGVATAAGGH
jgi:hypothetical protein